MARSTRGQRDGSGPYEGSYQRRTYGTGRRRQAGEECPVTLGENPGGSWLKWGGIALGAYLVLKLFKK